MPKHLKLTVRIGNKSKTFPTVKALAKAFNIDYGTLYQRLFVMGWTMKDAVKIKVRKKKKPKRKVAKKKSKKR